MLLLFNDAQFLQKREHLQNFRRKEVEALIVRGTDGDISWREELQRQDRPFILASNHAATLPAVVCVNDRTAIGVIMGFQCET